MRFIKKIGRLILENIYYTAMPSYKGENINFYNDLSIKFPKIEKYYIPHVMYQTEIDKSKNKVGNHYRFLFFKTLIHTINQYQDLFKDIPFKDIYWSEKHIDSSQALIIEHGWLPRSSYQISPTGANGRGAPVHVPKSYIEILGGKERLKFKLNLLKKCYKISIKPHRKDFGDNYIVIPMQLGSDLNLRDSSTAFSKFYGLKNATAFFTHELVKTINEFNLPFPVYFTQHPVDKKKYNINLRQQDRFFSSNDVSTLDLISRKQCKGIISVNSNVIHEALCLNVPCCVLGRLYWCEEQKSPFESTPKFFFDSNLIRPYEDEALMEYLAKLLCHQWYLSDFQNPLILRELLLNQEGLIPLQIRKKFSLA